MEIQHFVLYMLDIDFLFITKCNNINKQDFSQQCERSQKLVEKVISGGGLDLLAGLVFYHFSISAFVGF